MKTPKYTDLSRYPNDYTPSTATDVGKTIARERTRLKAEAEAQAAIEEWRKLFKYEGLRLGM